MGDTDLVDAVIGVAVVAPAMSPLVLLTTLGSHRRGLATPRALLTGLAFPVTWTVWYVRDEHPYRHADRILS